MARHSPSLRIRGALPLIGVVAVAFAVRLVPVLATADGLLGAPNYDPSVYYAAAVGFFDGRLPYRDFLLLHPPGIVLLLQPFAALGEWVGDPAAFATARVAVMVGGAASAGLVFVLLRRGGLLSALTGAGLYAIHPAAAHVERATWLEAPSTLLALLALVALRPSAPSVRSWRTVLAGALLATATLTKLWGVALLAVVVVWILATRGVRAALAAVLGAAGAAVLVLAPFWSVLPALWTDAVTAQLQRPSVRTDLVLRAGMLLGMDQATATGLPAALVIGLCLVVLAVAVLAVRSPSGRLSVCLLAASVGMLLTTASWYANYPAFAAAPLALAVGSSVSLVAGRLRPPGRRALGLVAG
ncbi:glycosyltransferase 87 family protein, partial [Propionicimonas sp.]|uniref:glycosyltransferase 87 family protein n=1 Tax=Propionicimonas sp. TaxID=1955623 RepID=UPI0039E24E98